MRGRGVLALYGDASQPTLLERAHVSRARVLAITYPDFVTAQSAIKTARAINPMIRIIARATNEGELGPLEHVGADELVQPEFEAGLEFVRQTLSWCDAPDEDTRDLLERRRVGYYEVKARAASS
jgi:CPA2 family monovalent cation:H+ antiporter-2